MSSPKSVTDAIHAIEQPLPSSPNGLAGVRVVVAEDEPLLMWALEEVLSDFGCRVVGKATTVVAAMALVDSEPFDVAVLDATLKDGTIDPVVAVLVERGQPFVLASGLASADSLERFGNALTLQKPYREADLRKSLIAALATSVSCANAA